MRIKSSSDKQREKERECLDKVDQFVERQRQSAKGQRSERLQEDLVGEKKLLSSVLLPALGTLEGIILEFELISALGPAIYIDAYYEPLRIAFECEGFTFHVEQMTRRRFTFEKKRVRTMTASGISLVPFSWDEMEHQPDLCQQTVRELINLKSRSALTAYAELTVYEREVVRYALQLNRPFKNKDVCFCLDTSHHTSREVIRKLCKKGMIRPLRFETARYHEYLLEEKAVRCLLDS